MPTAAAAAAEVAGFPIRQTRKVFGWSGDGGFVVRLLLLLLFAFKQVVFGVSEADTEALKDVTDNDNDVFHNE